MLIAIWAFGCGARNVLAQTSVSVLNVKVVEASAVQLTPTLPGTGPNNSSKIMTWEILSGIVAALLLVFIFTRKRGEAMKIKTIVRSLALLLFLAVVAGAGYYFLLSPQLNRNKAANSADQLFGWKFPVTKFPLTGSNPGQIAYSDIRDPGGVPQGLPVRLQIPVIGVDSAIEDALITPDGRMDVPAGSVDVAWFALGPHPGQVGSAVIGGHYGIQNGVPFVFYDLNKLKVGDNLYVIDDEGKTLTFVVRSTKSFNRNDDATPVFTSDDGIAHLNIITCEGIWNQVNGTYPLRLVVFTDLVSGGGVSTTLKTTASFSRMLGLGSRGTDVAALQAMLEQKGFLTIPAGVAPGVFGRLTNAAVVKYQISVGLPATGLFGPPTLAKITAEPTSTAILPNTGVNEPTTVKNPSTIGSLYATPLDGLVTSLLLVAIAFLLFEIISQFVVIRAR